MQEKLFHFLCELQIDNGVQNVQLAEIRDIVRTRQNLGNKILKTGKIAEAL